MVLSIYGERCTENSLRNNPVKTSFSNATMLLQEFTARNHITIVPLACTFHKSSLIRVFFCLLFSGQQQTE
jgi:hypothetical protein